MKPVIKLFLITLFIGVISCNQGTTESQGEKSSSDIAIPVSGGQEKVNDNVSQKDIVKIAISSKDHTTLVAALTQADLVTSLSNAGPFTVLLPPMRLLKNFLLVL